MHSINFCTDSAVKIQPTNFSVGLMLLLLLQSCVHYIVMYGDGAEGIEMVQVTLLRRTLTSFPESECKACGH